MRWSLYTDTPLPPDEPAGENPPDGATIHYALKEGVSGPLTLEILDGSGTAIRRYASTDPVEVPTSATAPVPLYWYRPPQRLETTAGLHRFLWDMHYQPLAGGGGGRGGGLGMTAVAHNSPVSTSAPWVAPGTYTVRLTVGGKSYTQPITVVLDPRVKTPERDLKIQFDLSKTLYGTIGELQRLAADLRSLRAQVKSLAEKAGAGAPAEALAAFDRKAADLEGAAPSGGPRGGGGGGNLKTLSGISAALTQLMGSLQGAEMGVTEAAQEAIAGALQAYASASSRWTEFRKTDLAALNAALKAAGRDLVEIKETDR